MSGRGHAGDGAELDSKTVGPEFPGYPVVHLRDRHEVE